MYRSYAVSWREAHGPVRSGKLELGDRGLRLEGAGELQELAYDELSAVKVGRSPSERVDGRPALLLERRTRRPLRIASVAEPGALSELAEELATRRLHRVRAMSRLVAVLPIRPGARGRVRELLRSGPPFDLETAGLERHEVFLTDDEVVFVFEAAPGAELERLLHETDLRAAAPAWLDVAAGLPRVAETAYARTRPSDPQELSYEPTPGPGDSDGGDIYAP